MLLNNVNVVTENEVLKDCSVLVQKDRIIDIISGKHPNFHNDDNEIKDMGGLYLGPGFVDIHCHAGGGHWVHLEPEQASNYHLKHGTTSLMATMLLLPSQSELVQGIKTIENSVSSGQSRNIIGIHMEGPYLNPRFGAYKELSKTPSESDIDELLAAGKGLVKLWTVAPEMKGVDEAIHLIQRKTSGKSVFEVGHSAASYEQIKAILPLNLRIATHCTDATGIPESERKIAGTRSFGLDEAVWLTPSIFAEMIPDSLGLHVRHNMLRLIMKIKGRERCIIVTDCTAADGPDNTGLLKEGGGDVAFNESGELAGSLLTMDQAFNNVYRLGNLNLPDVFRMASLNPAKAIGLGNEIGSIELGKRADLLLFSFREAYGIKVENVMLNGQWIK